MLKFVGAIAFVGYAAALWQEWIWYNRSWVVTLKSTIDGLNLRRPYRRRVRLALAEIEILGVAMLFMVVEHFKPGKAREIYRRFRERGRMAPDDVKYVASWVDLEFDRCSR